MEESNHEKYLRGEPLNPELARIREGRQDPSVLDPSGLQAETIPGKDHRDRPLTRKERADLKEMVQGEGWSILLRLMEKNVRIHVDSATVLSQSDPLQNAAAVASQWGYVKMYKRACAEMATLVLAEIAAMEEDEAK